MDIHRIKQDLHRHQQLEQQQEDLLQLQCQLVHQQ